MPVPVPGVDSGLPIAAAKGEMRAVPAGGTAEACENRALASHVPAAPSGRPGATRDGPFPPQEEGRE